MYYAIYLFKRVLLSCIIVFIQDHFFQIYTLIFFSLASVCYSIYERPFENPAINKLETFNELMTLVCCYHLLFFSEANPYYILKYQTGWGLDILILLQLLINISVYFSGFVYQMTFMIKRAIFLCKVKRQRIYSDNVS